MMITARELDFGRQLVSLILGIDEVYRRSIPPELEGLAREGWVAINLSQTPPLALTSYAEARTVAAELRLELEVSDFNAGRSRYFDDYLTAVDTFCEWREREDTPYGTLVPSLLGVPANPPDLAPFLEALEVRLRAAGFAGDVPAMIASFRESRTVPRAMIVETLTQYLAEARMWVDEELFRLPDDFQFRVEGESGLPYDAYCEYVGRYIRINLDMQFTHEDLKHLACHEAYPGHSTHILRREQLVRSGDMTEDGLLVVTDTPTNTIFEGVGEIGLTLVGWDQSEPEQINRLLIQLLTAVSAWAGYLFAEDRRDEALDLLRRYRDAGWAESRRELLDLPLRRPFIYAYFYGDQVVRQARDAILDQRAFLAHLFDRMHSPASLLMVPT